MNWPQLLCAERLGRDRPLQNQNPARSEYRRDSDRITFCTAFRRLQDKTQVFPLAENDYVRTRLTHSLEVASVGRSLGARVGTDICERHGLEGVHGSDFGEIVAAAALAHDLGNPPFGHSGEDAIRHWYATSRTAAEMRETFTPAQHEDFHRFEGNAQGFRLLTKLQMPDNAGGLQLTCATLGAFTKYPGESLVAERTPHPGASAKKFGFYQSEREHFATVAERCGLLRRASEAAWWVRHPLAFLMEAADDICYRVVDFEDGCRLGHLPYAEVEAALLDLIPEAQRPRRLASAQSDPRRVQILRSVAIGAAIEACAAVFMEHEEEMLAGTFDTPLIEATPQREAWHQIQQRSYETIYATPRGVEIESAGYEVLGGLLEIFVSALNEAAWHGPAASARSRKVLQLLPAETVGPQRRPVDDSYERLLRMTDFVSGMTDSYAVTLYRKLRGISHPGSH